MPGHRWSKTQHIKYSATMAAKRNGKKALPEAIFVVTNGRFQRYVLRTMTIYVPEKETSR